MQLDELQRSAGFYANREWKCPYSKMARLGGISRRFVEWQDQWRSNPFVMAFSWSKNVSNPLISANSWTCTPGIPIIRPVRPRPCRSRTTIFGAWNFRTGSRAHRDKTTGLQSINWPLEIFWLMIYCRIWQLYPCGIEFLCSGALIPKPDILYPTLISDFSPGVFYPGRTSSPILCPR